MFSLVAMIGFVLATWWLFTHRIDRFVLPILPLVAILAGRGAVRSSSPLWTCSVIGFMILAFLSNLSLICSPSIGDIRFFVSYQSLRKLGPEDLDEYNRHLNKTHQYLNEAVRPGYRALLCGEAQVFDLEMPVIYNTCFDDCVFERMMRGKTKEDRYETLRENRISHVLIRWYELDRYRSPGNYGYSPYTTRNLLRGEFVEQGLLRPIPIDVDPESAQVFEVAGWRTWDDSLTE